MEHSCSSYPKILAIETSTSMLSVALSCEGKVYFRSTESDGGAAGAVAAAAASAAGGVAGAAGTVAAGPNRHASLCAVFIDEVLREAGADLAAAGETCLLTETGALKASALDAVALSSGPGSYTGLRVGCSSAKGLCFGAGVPLIAVPTTEVLAKMVCRGGMGDAPSGPIIPMIDARRMEVYTATYKATSHSFEQVEPIHAQVVDAETFAGVTDAVFVGDGAAKCGEFLKGHGVIVDCHPSAHTLLDIACGKFIGARSQECEQNSGEQSQTGADNIFVDVAYFEPFYLKDFVATESKKKLW